MLQAFLYATRQRFTVDPSVFPDFPPEAKGLPRLSSSPCEGESCSLCASLCPTGAIRVRSEVVEIDRGLCLACGACMEACPRQTIVPEPSLLTATTSRQELMIDNTPDSPTRRNSWTGTRKKASIDVRVVSTGCSATDLEVNASLNPDFDGSRFGIHIVASPRFADALLVTGPVPRAMQDPLIRCYRAMPEPNVVVAAGCAAISGGLFRDGYTGSQGVSPHLPVDVFIPGNPPHPLSVSFGLVLAEERLRAKFGTD